MLRKLINIFFLTVALLSVSSQAYGRQLKARIDSSQITMGYQTAIRFDIVNAKDAPSEIMVDKASMPPEIEIVDWVYGDTTDLGNNQVEMTRALIVQAFDSGVYTIPPFFMVSGGDTLRSQAFSLKVNPVDVSKLTDVHPIAAAMDYETKWYDFLPDWITDYWLWILCAVVLIAAGVCAYLILISWQCSVWSISVARISGRTARKKNIIPGLPTSSAIICKAASASTPWR